MFPEIEKFSPRFNYFYIIRVVIGSGLSTAILARSLTRINESSEWWPPTWWLTSSAFRGFYKALWVRNYGIFSVGQLVQPYSLLQFVVRKQASLSNFLSTFSYKSFRKVLYNRSLSPLARVSFLSLSWEPSTRAPDRSKRTNPLPLGVIHRAMDCRGRFFKKQSCGIALAGHKN